MPINDPNVSQTYKSFELAAVKRLANRWQFTASYSATKKNIPVVDGLTATALGLQSSQVVGDFTPNDDINRADRTWDWDGKATGPYLFPADVLLSADFHHTSGDAFTRQVQFRGGKTIPSIVLNVEPIGTHRLPNVNMVSLRAEKSFRVSAAHKLAVRLNVYNALNASTASTPSGLSLQPRAGAEFLRPRAIMPPRIAEVSASYTF